MTTKMLLRNIDSYHNVICAVISFAVSKRRSMHISSTNLDAVTSE